MNEYINELESYLIEILGYEQLCEAIIRQMSYDEKVRAFEYIARMYEVEADSYDD